MLTIKPCLYKIMLVPLGPPGAALRFRKMRGPGSRVHKPKSRTWDPIYYKVKLVVKEDPVGTGAPRLGPKSGAR